MRKLHFLLCFCWLFTTHQLQAQISYGGTPTSFGTDFQKTKLAETALQPYALPALDMVRVKEEDASKATNRFAAASSVNVQPNNAGLWQDLPNGDRLWRVLLQVQTKEVYGMRLLFDKFQIPQGGKLFMYSQDKKIVLGAFTQESNLPSGMFATTLIKGREVVMEYYEPASVKGQVVLSLNRIDQAYKNIYLNKQKKGKKSYSPSDFGESDGCNLDVNCTALANDWQDEKRGVVRILIVASNGSGYCSGSLINNTSNDNKPYILTANHCGEGSTTTHINQWVFDFNYEVTNCTSPTEPTPQSMTGATLRAKYANSDVFLVELQQTIPNNYNVYFNGWNRTATLPANTASIHHPAGDVKKICFDNQTGVSSDIDGIETSNGNYIKVSWDAGVTEGGSSGSPLFNGNGLIVGQLYGGESFCATPQAPDWYGKVSVSWTGGGTSATRLSDWLDPTNTGATSLVGKEGGGTLANFTISPATTVYLPDAVTFTDASAGTITSRSWSFGSGASTATATTVGPHNITYNTAGVKTVSLNVNSGASIANRTLLVMPTLTPEYTLANGGNFETNTTHFASFTKSGSGFERGNSTVAGKNGVVSGSNAWVTSLADTEYDAMTETQILTPNFNFSQAGTYTLQFKTKFATEEDYDGFIVQYSTNKGQTWTQLGSAVATDWYNKVVASNVGTGGFAPGTALFSGSVSAYETKSFNVSFLAGTANVAFRFLFKADDFFQEAGVAIDDFQVLYPFTAISFLPAHNATGINTTNDLSITFNRNVTKSTGNLVIKKFSDNSVVETIDVANSAITVAGAVVTINPANALPDGKLYVEVPNTAFKDANNNFYAGFSGGGTWAFTTVAVDVTAPTLVTLNPANNATGHAIAGNLVMTFNENVKKGAGNIVIKKASDDSVFETMDITSANVTISNAVVTINPTNNLGSLTMYYVTVDNGAIQDIANNNYAGFSNNTTWKFTTAEVDMTAPTATNYSPAHNSTTALIATNLVVTFSENVQKGTSGSIVIKKNSDNSIFETINITDAKITVSNNVVTINPTNDLAYVTEYYVEITAGTIQDLANNNFAGITGNGTWKFTTANETTPPTIVSFNPAHNSTNFAGANNLTMTFSENVQKGTSGTIVIKKLSDNSTFASINITDASITVSGAMVTINPANDLTFNTDFYVEVSAGAIKDLAGNNFAGFTGSNTWKFKTDFSTAVEDNTLGKAITVYPNPTMRWGTLLIQEGVTLRDADFRLFDASGKTIWKTAVKQVSKMQSFDWENLPAGKYWLEIKTAQGKTLKAIVKQ